MLHHYTTLLTQSTAEYSAVHVQCKLCMFAHTSRVHQRHQVELATVVVLSNERKIYYLLLLLTLLL